MSDLGDICRCATCTDPKAAMEADMAEQGVERCICCGEWPYHGCRCEIVDVDVVDRETGYRSERGCLTHRREV